MYCRNCGSLLDDRAVVCPHCGVPVDDNFMMRQPVKANGWLVTVAKVFIILAFVAYGISLLVLLSLTFASLSFLGEGALYEDYLVFYVMLVYLIVVLAFGVTGVIFGVKTLKNIKAKTKPSTAVCICTLIFTNIIAGILLLCTKDEDYL